MRSLLDHARAHAKPLHPYQWLWEPLSSDPGFDLRPMFGGRSAYLDGRLVLFFAAKSEPWRGVFVCTEREHHVSLLAEFSALAPHSVLPKWLYLSESADAFERTASALVRLAARRDPRLGIVGKTKRKSAPRAHRLSGHP